MKYKSEIYEVVHHDAVALFEAGAISEAEKRKFDEMCLVGKAVTVPETENPTGMEHNAPAVV